MPRRRQMHERIRRMRVRCFCKHGRGLRMARLARFAPDKLAAARVRRRIQPKTFQAASASSSF